MRLPGHIPRSSSLTTLRRSLGKTLTPICLKDGAHSDHEEGENPDRRKNRCHVLHVDS